MTNNHPPSVTSALPAAIILSLGGWSGIWYLMTQTEPTLWPRWLFFFSIVVALTGTVLPFIAFLNWRFPTDAPVSYGVVVREAIWMGIYAASLVWLNKGQVLNIGLTIVLGVGFLLAESLLRMRARSQWRPGEK
ncbi:MAG: hypothetical protein U9O54_08020, partial [Chloroflexota bacterium]|nr:hypothetical protein [Chloroflexota bacterium]